MFLEVQKPSVMLERTRANGGGTTSRDASHGERKGVLTNLQTVVLCQVNCETAMY